MLLVETEAISVPN